MMRTHLASLLAFAGLVGSSIAAEAATYSLADDFSSTVNTADGIWSFGLADGVDGTAYRLLPSASRDANALWGSDCPDAPMMWSDASGYWGIGKNGTGRELSSAKLPVKWAPGEVLLHPKGGEPPSGMVIAWTAPADMMVEVRYAFGVATKDSDGVGLKIVRSTDRTQTEILSVPNVGERLANALQGIRVSKGERILFCLDTCGSPGGDIARAEITIETAPTPAVKPNAPQPSGSVITEGSDLTLSVPVVNAKAIQWLKDGKPIPGATGVSYRIRNVVASDGGAYSAEVDSVAGGTASVKVDGGLWPPEPLQERFPSRTPKYVFSQTLAEQEKELEANAMMLRFAESRRKMAGDPWRPAYHFVSPENMMNDPNGLCFWQGRWHLFYQAYPADEFPSPADILKRRQHWGHAVSDDLVHWKDLPYAIHPGYERMCFSGGTVVEEHQVVAFYPGIDAGQMVAIAKDPLLLNWYKKAVRAPMQAGDACIWKEGNVYFGLVSANRLVSSTNLVQWADHGAFLENNPFPIGDALACPYFLPVGDKHVLLTFSHTTGGHYFLGRYDKLRHKFTPDEHGRFNHGMVAPGGVHAPSAAADGAGGVINILNINDGRYTEHWDQLMSVPQRLTLGPDAKLRIDPVQAIASLRGDHKHVDETILSANEEIVLEDIKGKSLELDLEIDPKDARWVQLNVFRSPDAEEQTSITFFNYDRKLAYWYQTPGMICLDGSRSSTLPDAWPRPPEMAVLERGSEPLKLRIFVDRSVVEVFANGKVYLAQRVYPGRQDSVGVSIRAQGQEAVLKRLDAWRVKPIWPIAD